MARPGSGRCGLLCQTTGCAPARAVRSAGQSHTLGAADPRPGRRPRLRPGISQQELSPEKADQANIKGVGRQLAELTRHELQKRPPTLEPTQKALEAVTDLGDQLTKKTLTRSEALKDLANVAEKLKDQLKEMGKDPMMKRLEQAARATTGNDAQSASGLQKQM